MFARLALESDIDEVCEMARANIEETCPGTVYDDFTCRETYYSYLDTASPTIFVVEDKREVIGFLLADMYSQRASQGTFVTQEVLYVKPARRGTRAATLLMKQLIAWAETIRASEIIGGNDNDFNSDRTAKFLEHFGFRRVGYAMRKAL